MKEKKKEKKMDKELFLQELEKLHFPTLVFSLREIADFAVRSPQRNMEWMENQIKKVKEFKHWELDLPFNDYLRLIAEPEQMEKELLMIDNLIKFFHGALLHHAKRIEDLYTKNHVKIMKQRGIEI